MGRSGTGGSFRFGTSLQAGQSSEPSRTRHRRGTTPRGAVSQAPCGALERALKKVHFVAASRPDSPIRPQLRQVDWRRGIASDEELMDRATGKMVGIGGSAISSMTGQLTSAEIEEVRGLSCGALDPEFDAEEDAAREMCSQSDL